MRISRVWYLVTINPLVCIPVYNLLPLEDLVGEIHASASPDAQPNPPQIFQTPLHIHHSRSKLTPENL